MKWFRFYAEALHDPKVQKLPPELFKHWVNMMCCACENGGTIPSVDHFAFSLRITNVAAGKILIQLKDRDLLDCNEGSMEPHNWGSRQFKSDTSAARVKRLRDKQKSVSSNDDVTLHETEMKRHYARDPEQNRTEQKSISLLLDSEILPSFQKWIALYPSKIKTDDACQAWISLCSTGEIRQGNLSEVFAGLERWKKSKRWRENGGKYICEPKTFLVGNEKSVGHLWKDYPAPAEDAEPVEYFKPYLPPLPEEMETKK